MEKEQKTGKRVLYTGLNSSDRPSERGNNKEWMVGSHFICEKNMPCSLLKKQVVVKQPHYLKIQGKQEEANQTPRPWELPASAPISWAGLLSWWACWQAVVVSVIRKERGKESDSSSLATYLGNSCSFKGIITISITNHHQLSNAIGERSPMLKCKLRRFSNCLRIRGKRRLPAKPWEMLH